MAEQLNPKTARVDGRTAVNRDWIRQETGAKLSTAKRWYAKRADQPEEARHPEKLATIDRVDYYDREEFMRFYTALEERKKESVLPTDPQLYAGGPDDWISINEATELFHFATPGTIRKYLSDFPGYFPAPVGTVEGLRDRPIPAFRRFDLQQFDQQRTGTGPVGVGTGRPTNSSGTAQRHPKTLFRVKVAREQMERSGGWYRGVATELARRHGELKSLNLWSKAVQEARKELDGEAANQSPKKGGSDAAPDAGNRDSSGLRAS